MEELIALLKEKQWTIGSCESFTAGLFTATLAGTPGASAVLKGGIVTYATSVKTQVVHVEESIVKEYGVISGPCAKQMAEKARALLAVDVCVSFTGNAGPDRMEGKPAGEIYCAIACQKETKVFCYHLAMERNEVRKQAVQLMCEELIKLLTS